MHLSKPQKSIYNMDRFIGGSSANICSSMLYSGNINIDLVQDAVNELFRLNDVLRTRLKEVSGDITQNISEFKKRNFEIIKFNNIDEFSDYVKLDSAIDRNHRKLRILRSAMPNSFR